MDVKSGNVLIDKNGTAVLTDFGLAIQGSSTIEVSTNQPNKQTTNRSTDPPTIQPTSFGKDDTHVWVIHDMAW